MLLAEVLNVSGRAPSTISVDFAVCQLAVTLRKLVLLLLAVFERIPNTARLTTTSAATASMKHKWAVASFVLSLSLSHVHFAPGSPLTTITDFVDLIGLI